MGNYISDDSLYILGFKKAQAKQTLFLDNLKKSNCKKSDRLRFTLTEVSRQYMYDLRKNSLSSSFLCELCASAVRYFSMTKLTPREV
jgi:hypothetical protein